MYVRLVYTTHIRRNYKTEKVYSIQSTLGTQKLEPYCQDITITSEMRSDKIYFVTLRISVVGDADDVVILVLTVGRKFKWHL
jgi:hypothetical protein